MGLLATGELSRRSCGGLLQHQLVMLFLKYFITSLVNRLN